MWIVLQQAFIIFILIKILRFLKSVLKFIMFTYNGVDSDIPIAINSVCLCSQNLVMQCALIFILVRKKLQICTQSCIKNNNSRGEKSRFLPLYSLEFPLPPQETLEASEENHTIHLVVVLWQYGVDWGRNPRLPPLAPKVPQIHKNALFGNLLFFFFILSTHPFAFLFS